MPKKKTDRKERINGQADGKSSKFTCYNKDCKLRKQKSCKGFEGCPGFQSR